MPSKALVALYLIVHSSTSSHPVAVPIRAGPAVAWHHGGVAGVGGLGRVAAPSWLRRVAATDRHRSACSARSVGGIGNGFCLNANLATSLHINVIVRGEERGIGALAARFPLPPLVGEHRVSGAATRRVHGHSRKNGAAGIRW